MLRTKGRMPTTNDLGKTQTNHQQVNVARENPSKIERKLWWEWKQFQHVYIILCTRSVADKNVVRHIFEWSQQHQRKSHCSNGNDVRLLSVYSGLQSCKDQRRIFTTRNKLIQLHRKKCESWLVPCIIALISSRLVGFGI